MALEDIVPFRNRKRSLARRDSNQDYPFFALRHGLDRLFEDFFKGFDIEPFGGTAMTFVPRLSVEDKENQIEITAELPGLDEKDIDISIVDDVLTIRGEKKDESEEKGKDYYRSERLYGAFSRSIQLPAGTDDSKIAASVKKGVLTVTVPKSPQVQAKRKKIEVKSE